MPSQPYVVALTPAELLARSKELAQVIAEIRAIQSEKRDVNRDLKAREDALQKRAGELARAVRFESEERDPQLVLFAQKNSGAHS